MPKFSLEDQTRVLGPFPHGMNNRQPSHALPVGTARNSVNGVFDNLGKFHRRGGLTKVYSGMGLSNGYRCELGRFFVENGQLRRLLPNNTSEVICEGILGSDLTYNYFNGTLYFSDGLVNKKVTSSTCYNWGLTPPAELSVYSVSGTYGAGTYLAACVWVDHDGVESGASDVISIDVPSNSGFVFTNLPNKSDPQISVLRIYLSTANGELLYRVADISPGTYSYTILSGRYDAGIICASLEVTQPPPGRVIRFYNGRAYVADSVGTIWYSDPYEYDRFRPADNYIMLTKPVDILEPVTAGIFIAYGDTTYFYGGTPENGFNPVLKFNYGGVFKTGAPIPNSPQVSWQSQRGMIVGSPDGSCENLQEKHVAVESAVSGATLIQESNGLRQYIVSLNQPTTSRMAATSWIDAEIIRRGA